jgi:hypothetical protein
VGASRGGGDRAQRGQLTLRVGAAREFTPGKPVQLGWGGCGVGGGGVGQKR